MFLENTAHRNLYCEVLRALFQDPDPQDLCLSYVPIDRVLSFLSYVPRILTHSGFWNPNLPVAL